MLVMMTNNKLSLAVYERNISANSLSCFVFMSTACKNLGANPPNRGTYLLYKQ